MFLNRDDTDQRANERLTKWTNAVASGRRRQRVGSPLGDNKHDRNFRFWPRALLTGGMDGSVDTLTGRVSNSRLGWTLGFNPSRALPAGGSTNVGEESPRPKTRGVRSIKIKN